MLANIWTEATSTRARRVATYTATTIGGAWLLGKYAVNSLVQGAECSRKEAAEKHDLANRFGLALQDAQFTVLALVPTVATQLSENLDVEARSRELADLAKREKEEKQRRAAAEAAAATAPPDPQAEDNRAQTETPQEAADSVSPPTKEEVAPGPAPTSGAETTTVGDATGKNGGDGHFTSDAQIPEAPARRSSASSPLSLNPAAPAFQPRFASAPSPPPSGAKVAPSASAPAEDFPSLSNEPHVADENSVNVGSPKLNGHAAHDDAEGLANVGKSWADIVKENAPSAENGRDDMPGQDTQQGRKSGKDQREDADADGHGEKAKDAVAQEFRVEESLPTRSKAELWHEIKTLSFTRLITSIYVLVLLTLQTHVQLALLGRASYVSSLLSSLPPRTPSPPPHKRLQPPPLPPYSDSAPTMDGDDVDLELALYDAKQVALTAEDVEEERRDVERKYLTFSWWLLHEGWKLVEKRVEGAVEAVVGPMGLKAPLVYGELGALFGEIRGRVERNEDGTLFDFSAALHPPTFELEVQTLIAGGSYVPSPATSPSVSTTSHNFPPSTPPSTVPGCRSPISPALRALLHETSDALDSPDAALVRALSLDAMFSLLLQRLEPAFVTGGGGEDHRGSRFEDVSEKTTRLASLLPFVTKLAGTTGGIERGVLSSGVNGNEFVEALEDVRELREFCAVLYGSWDRDDLRASCVL